MQQLWRGSEKRPWGLGRQKYVHSHIDIYKSFLHDTFTQEESVLSHKLVLISGFWLKVIFMYCKELVISSLPCIGTI